MTNPLSVFQHTPTGHVPAFLSPAATETAWAFHHTLPDYAPTPLVPLRGWAQAMGVKAVFVKDESPRFGLNAFKGLGGIYALARAAGQVLGLPEDLTWAALQTEAARSALAQVEFVTATDGNHGRGVAWAARRLGCRAHVYLPAGSVPARAQAILKAGAAQAEILPLSYDETVQYAARMAEAHGWQLIQDTSWPGYEAVPTWIIQGYTTMAREAADQLAQAGHPRPTHVFLQAGVGAMAGGVLGCLAARYGDQAPVFVSVEPEDIPCIYRSALAASPTPWRARPEPSWQGSTAAPPAPSPGRCSETGSPGTSPARTPWQRPACAGWAAPCPGTRRWSPGRAAQ